jgi:hypothetical protein
MPAAARRHQSTTERGYGHAHQRQRARLLPHAVGTMCPLCGLPMLEGQALDLDHSRPRSIDPTSRGDRITHASCNRSAGAVMRQQRRRQVEGHGRRASRDW